MQYKDLIVINIGKNGLDNDMKEHIKILLKQHNFIKLKFLNKSNFTEIGIPGKIIKVIGRTIILRK